MALSASQIKFMYSNPSATAGNQLSQSNPNASLGGYISTTQWNGGVLYDLFDLITGDENAASQVDYRCVFVYNSSTTNTFYGPVIWIASQVAGGADATIGLDPTAVTILSATSAQALTIATTTTTPPSTVVFSNPTTKSAGLSTGDLPPGYVCAVWIKRAATNSPPVDNDGVTLQIQGDTSA